MKPPANTPIIPHVESGGMTNPTMNPLAYTPSIPHVESGGVTNPTFKVERDVVMNPPANTPSIPHVESGGVMNPTINPPANTPIIPHMESGAVAIPKVDKDGGNALIKDDSVPVIEIKPTKKWQYGRGTSSDTVTKSCTCCPDDEYESDYYDKYVFLLLMLII